MPLSEKKMGEIGEILTELLIQESGDSVVPYVLVIMPLATGPGVELGEGGYVSNIEPLDAARELRRTADYLENHQNQKKEIQQAIAEAAGAKKH
jgi:hypothetical protein